MSDRPHLSEEGSDLDRKFFAANPNRNHFVRWATPDEVVMFERFKGRLLDDEFAPGIRLRYWRPAIPVGPVPGDEKTAKIIFEMLDPNGAAYPARTSHVQP